jgi:hypothetical protein
MGVVTYAVSKSEIIRVTINRNVSRRLSQMDKAGSEYLDMSPYQAIKDLKPFWGRSELSKK